MAKFIRFCVKLVLGTIAVLTVYFLTTYQDYTNIYKDAYHERDSTILIVIHHDAIPYDVGVDAIENQHKIVNKWESGFAYTFYFVDGKIIQMNPLDKATGHALHYNNNAIGICCHTPDRFKIRTQFNMWCVTQFLKLYYGIDSIAGHRELPDNLTECPGYDFNMDSARSPIEYNLKQVAQSIILLDSAK